MPVTEIERSELVNKLVATIGKETTVTLMKCILPDGHDLLATKSDLIELRGYVDSVLAKQIRLYIVTLAGFMFTIWATLIVQIIA